MNLSSSLEAYDAHDDYEVSEDLFSASFRERQLMGERSHPEQANPESDKDPMEGDSSDAESTAESTRVQDPLLPRSSRKSRKNHSKFILNDSSKQQIVDFPQEDLQILITGYSTNTKGLIIYALLCVFSLGLAYLLLRWIPRWRVELLGIPTNLAKSKWLVIEDQYGQLEVINVHRIPFGGLYCDVFTHSTDTLVLHFLSVFVYRHIRFILDPMNNRFFDIRYYAVLLIIVFGRNIVGQMSPV